jgi:hypothetical protein
MSMEKAGLTLEHYNGVIEGTEVWAAFRERSYT